MSAVISPCGQYRYVLTRKVPCALRWVRPVLFVMLNPSTADADADDATIRKCIGFAKLWTCSELTVVNLFGLRSTDPAALRKHADPVGPDNDWHLAEQAQRHAGTAVVAAWGAHPFAAERARDVSERLRRIAGLECLGRTKAGHPRHPLYVPYSQALGPL